MENTRKLGGAMLKDEPQKYKFKIREGSIKREHLDPNFVSIWDDVQKNATNVNTLQELLNQYYSTMQNAISFKGNKEVVPAGETTSVTFTFDCINASNNVVLNVYHGTTLVWHDNVSVFPCQFTLNDASEGVYRCEANVDGIKYVGLWEIKESYDFWIGTGTNYNAVIANPSYKHVGASSLSGTYFLNPNAGDYIYIICRSNVVPASITMSGFEVPFAIADTVTIAGVEYSVYASSNTYQAGNIELVVNDIQYDADSYIAHLIEEVLTIKTKADDTEEKVETIADEETIEVIPSGEKQGKIALKNRPMKRDAMTDEVIQKGYVILKEDDDFKEVVESYTDGNVIFEINYAYNLDDEEVTIPEGCTLKFEGGSVSNGTLVGDDTEIVAGLVRLFDLDVTLDGSWNTNAIYSKWWDLSTVANANVGLQKIFDFAYLSKGADVVFCSGEITFSNTITIKTYTVQSGYRGWGLVIRGRNNFDATLNYTGSSHTFIFTEAGTAGKFTDVEFRNIRIVAANATDILYASKGSNLRIYNCSFSSLSGICVNITDLWYWRVEQSTFEGTTCIKTTKGTSGYISNVVVNGVDYGINISGAYVRIDNIFSDICTGILCYFNACRVNISTIATESTALTTIISGINSHVEIGDAFFFKPASASASIFDGSGTTISVQNVCIKDQGDKTTARCYLLGGSYANTLVRIARLEIDSKLLPQPYNDTNAANRGVHISRIVDSATKDGEYREWATIINDKNTTDDYSSLPKYNNARLIVGLQEPLKIATNIYDEQGNITSHGTSTQASMGKVNDIYFNTYPAGGFPYFAWSRVSQTGAALNLGTNKFVQFVDTVDSVSNAPTNVKVGHCIFCTGLGKPIWAKVVSGGSVTWVDATGTTVS